MTVGMGKEGASGRVGRCGLEVGRGEVIERRGREDRGRTPSGFRDCGAIGTQKK